MTKIVVSPGHTKDYPGVRKNGKVEHDIVNRLSDILVEDLKSQDVDVIKTDGAGNLSWAADSSATNLEATDTTDLDFDSTSTVAMFHLPANAVVRKVAIVVDAPFDGTPSLSIGVTGELSRYLGSTQVDLTAAAGTVFEVDPALAAVGAAEDLIATYAAAGATQGTARILVSYVIPS